MTDTQTASIEDLVRLVVARTSDRARDSDPQQRDPNTEDIMVDVVVEGSRYLLIRLPKPAQIDVQQHFLIE